MAEKDPFTKVYDALWEMLERNQAFSGLSPIIKTNNKIKYDSWIGGKDDVSTADYPELALLMDGGLWNFNYTSSHGRFERVYSWAVTTGSFIVENYNQILWEVCRSMSDWDKYICGIVWRDEQVVNMAATGELTEGTYRVEQNRGIRGWSSMWSINVVFMVPTELMRIS